MRYYVYILYSQSSDRYYTGYSSDPEESLIEHKLGATTSTKTGRPWSKLKLPELIPRADKY
jgi:putative endonuclease